HQIKQRPEGEKIPHPGQLGVIDMHHPVTQFPVDVHVGVDVMAVAPLPSQEGEDEEATADDESEQVEWQHDQCPCGPSEPPTRPAAEGSVAAMPRGRPSEIYARARSRRNRMRGAREADLTTGAALSRRREGSAAVAEAPRLACWRHRRWCGQTVCLTDCTEKVVWKCQERGRRGRGGRASGGRRAARARLSRDRGAGRSSAK